MTKKWTETLSEWDNNKIIELIVSFTPKEVQELLNAEDPPTLSKIQGLTWKHTSEPGVYIKIIDAKEMYVYVGSATSISGGLNKRRCDHEKSVGLDEMSYHRRLMLHENGVKKSMRFGTLFLMPWSSNLSSANVEFTRKVCLLAEAIFASMLGAYKSGVPCILEDACPYGTPLAVFEWKGACSHSCLTENQRTPKVQMTAEEWHQHEEKRKEKKREKERE
jgi:hypothetical protein